MISTSGVLLVAALGSTLPIPKWITAAVAEKHAANSKDSIEEERYQGKQVFQFTSGYRFDTGDEHVLYDSQGRVICRFGGIVGRVTSGTCDISKIKYVRTIYPPKT